MSCLNPDLNLLRVFDAVRVEQNLTRAASRLATTQPAVSNAVRRLRDRLGDELLIRTARGVKPTPRPCCAARSTWRSVFFGAVTQRDARSPAHGWLREHLQTIMLNETAGRVRLVR